MEESWSYGVAAATSSSENDENLNKISVCIVLQSRVDFMQLMVDSQASMKDKDDTNSPTGKEHIQVEESNSTDWPSVWCNTAKSCYLSLVFQQ